jgi:RHS repeat-associated protein
VKDQPGLKCKNNPKCTAINDRGPIPQGDWQWTDDYNSKPNGRVLLPLFDANRTNIRSHSYANAFGPSRGPKFCSEGCLTGSPADIKKLNQLPDAEPGSTLKVTD